MRSALALGLAGVFATLLQGALAGVLPLPWCPDLGLLFAIAVGLAWRSAAGGLVLVALLGYLGDVLAGTLLGQQALLRVAAFGLARVASLQVNLMGALPQAFFAGLLSVLYGLALGATTTFFVASASPVLAPPGALVLHALANALAAPLVASSTARLLAALGQVDARRRFVRLEPGGFTG